jgi:FAD/FMN-containing dehydrogenase
VSVSDRLIKELAGVVGEAHVLASPEAMAPHLTDWRGRYTGRALCVVKPAETEQVARVAALCSAARTAMVPQGGNTGLCGGATPDRSGEAVVICMSRLNRIRALDLINDTVTVEAGCVLQRVREAADARERVFPLALAAQGSCEIGGNLSTNAGGVHVLRYGNMRELTLGLEVVLPDGRVWDGLRALRKDNSGYDLKQLFIGAEGTLGIITAAVLKLYPKPRATAVAWAAVPGPAAAVELLGRLRARFGERLTAFEIIARAALDLVLRHIPGARAPIAGEREWHLLIEVDDHWEDIDLAHAIEEALAAELEHGLVLDAVVARSLAQAQAMWNLRENISESQRVEGYSIKHDISVPVSRIPEFIERAGEALRREFDEVRIVCFGHIGDGNLHYNLSRPISLPDDAFIGQAAAANRVVHDLVARLGGSVSAEHGVGQLRRAELTQYKSPVEMDLMRSVKRALDPFDLMNPGKVL